MNTMKEKLHINKVVSTKKEIILIEGDMIIPDSKPDIINTICTSGVVCLYKKEIMEERIRIDGTVNTYIMYLAESNQGMIRSINTNLDFSEMIQISNLKENMYAEVQMKVKMVECKVINGRKVGIKASVEVEINVCSCEEIDIISQLDNINEVQMLKENLKVNSLVGMGETKINTKDTIILDNIDNLAEILKVEVNIINKDMKISYNKVLTKAEAEMKIMYLTEDNRIKVVNSKIPVVGFIDIQNVVEGNICESSYEMKNILVRLNQVDEHSVCIEIDVDVRVSAYEEKEIELIQDIYSPCENLEFNKKRLSTVMDKRYMYDIKQIREKMVIEGIENKQILDVQINPVIKNEVKRKNKIVYEIDLEMKYILVDNQKIIDIKNANISFEYTVDNVSDIEDLNNRLMIDVKNADYIMQDGEVVTANVDLGMNLGMYKIANLNMIDEIKTNGQREIEDYNVIIYIVKKDDTLWKIAKKFGSTIEDIVRVNGIENIDLIEKGQKLFIPKYNRQKLIIPKDEIINYA